MWPYHWLALEKCKQTQQCHSSRVKTSLLVPRRDAHTSPLFSPQIPKPFHPVSMAADSKQFSKKKKGGGLEVRLTAALLLAPKVLPTHCYTLTLSS